MEVHVIDTAQVSRQLVDNFPGVDVPDVDVPTTPMINLPLPDGTRLSPVGAPSSHHGAVRTPGAVEKILLEVVVVASEDLDTPLPGTERPGVPDPQRVVHGVGQDVTAVRRELHPSDGVSVALQQSVLVDFL